VLPNGAPDKVRREAHWAQPVAENDHQNISIERRGTCRVRRFLLLLLSRFGRRAFRFWDYSVLRPALIEPFFCCYIQSIPDFCSSAHREALCYAVPDPWRAVPRFSLTEPSCQCGEAVRASVPAYPIPHPS